MWCLILVIISKTSGVYWFQMMIFMSLELPFGRIMTKSENSFISLINHQLEPDSHFLLDDVNGLLTLQNEGHDLVSHLGRFYTVAAEVDFSNTQNEFASVIEFDPNTNSLSHYIQEDTLINGFPLFPSTLIPFV
jgi:hypothetical protein